MQSQFQITNLHLGHVNSCAHGRISFLWNFVVRIIYIKKEEINQEDYLNSISLFGYAKFRTPRSKE